MSSPNEPIFILCPARSGSTLLRLVLHRHPDIAAPPELNLAVIFSAIEFAITGAIDDAGRAEESTRRLSQAVAAEIMSEYMSDKGIDKPRWCDKSLPSVEHADLLGRVFPDAQFICLYRNARDNIASLLEASPWGLGGYGVEVYCRSFPTNAVLALAQHWLDKTAALLAFEQSHECLRVRYEDLVTTPSPVLRNVCAFLGLAWDDRLLAVENASPLGRGDHKTRYISGFDQTSIGSGWTVPWGLIPEPLQMQIAELSTRLGYADPAIPGIPLAGDSSAPAPLGDSRYGTEIETIMTRRVGPRVGANVYSNDAGYRRFALELVDTHDRWLIDLDHGVARSSESAECTIVADAPGLIGIAQQGVNPAVLLRQSRLQFRRDGDDPMTASEIVGCLDRLVELLQQGL